MNNLQKDFILLKRLVALNNNKDVVVNLEKISSILQTSDTTYEVHMSGNFWFTIDKENYNILKEKLLGE